jgi:hypothetical protein
VRPDSARVRDCCYTAGALSDAERSAARQTFAAAGFMRSCIMASRISPRNQRGALGSGYTGSGSRLAATARQKAARLRPASTAACRAVRGRSTGTGGVAAGADRLCFKTPSNVLRGCLMLTRLPQKHGFNRRFLGGLIPSSCRGLDVSRCLAEPPWHLPRLRVPTGPPVPAHRSRTPKSSASIQESIE